MSASVKTVPRTIEWVGGLDGYVAMIDQTRLPTELVILECRDVESMWQAIRRLSVRGAPAIGIAAAMGAVLGVRECDAADREALFNRLEEVCRYLATSRPTAVNLSWALQRMQKRARSLERHDVQSLKQELLEEAKRIRDEDAATCRAIGAHGLPLIRAGTGLLTHCNAGGLATAEFGTALAPMYTAHQKGTRFHVYVDETRPLLQGSRLTAWELQQAGIDVTLLCDGAAASLLKTGQVQLVITGADRIAANGDVANKIGTYGLAVLAKSHGVPFYVAAPASTFDLSLADGSEIPIEFRDAEEIRSGFGRPTAPPDVECYGPAFDVTPAELVSGIITEHGVIEPVTPARITEVIRAPATANSP